MKIIESSFVILSPTTTDEGAVMLKQIERVARTCYKSEDKITDESSPRFVKMLIDRGHHAMIEFGHMTVRFVCDRGVSHELVRHRLCSFAQESTRYVNYKEGIEVICPKDLQDSNVEFGDWSMAMRQAETSYRNLITRGVKPEIARSVLPNALKTEINVCANLREWRHIFQLRTAITAHPQMRELMGPLLEQAKTLIPVVFEDISDNLRYQITLPKIVIDDSLPVGTIKLVGPGGTATITNIDTEAKQATDPLICANCGRPCTNVLLTRGLCPQCFAEARDQTRDIA